MTEEEIRKRGDAVYEPGFSAGVCVPKTSSVLIT